jgi:hypothetical protein
MDLLESGWVCDGNLLWRDAHYWAILLVQVIDIEDATSSGHSELQLQVGIATDPWTWYIL